MTTLERRPIDSLTSNPRNPRRHDLAALTGSIRRFGFRSALVVDASGQVLAGHGRLAALLALRASGEPAPEGVAGWVAPCLVVPVESQLDALAFVVADNRVQELTRWRRDELAEILVELAEGDALDGVGYDVAAVESMAAAVDAARQEVEALAEEAASESAREEPTRTIVLTFTDPRQYARILELLAAAPGTTYADKVERALAIGAKP